MTNEPLRKTRLTLRMNVAAMTTQRQQQPAATSTYTVTSDASGKFEFANVDPGDYQLTIRRDGFANLVLGAKNAARKTDPILLGAGDRKTDFLVRLVPYGTISGSVLDEDGDPIRGMTVAAMTYRYTTSGRELQEARTASSNDLGEYRIFDVPAGKYFLKVGQRNLQLNGSAESAEAYGSVFYPGLSAGLGRHSAGGHSRGAIAQPQFQSAQDPLRHHPRKGDRTAQRDQCRCGNDDRHRERQQQQSGARTGKDFHFEFFGVNPGPLFLVGSYLLNGQRYNDQPADRGGRYGYRWHRTAAAASDGARRPGAHRRRDYGPACRNCS